MDFNAKGKKKGDDVIARLQIPQNTLRNIFRKIKEDSNLKNILNKILTANDSQKIEYINELYSKYQDLKHVTTPQGVLINAFLFIYNPREFFSICSLNHRFKLLEYLEVKYEFKNKGEEIIGSNNLLKEVLKPIEENTRIISTFFYDSEGKDLGWKGTQEEELRENSIELFQNLFENQEDKKLIQNIIYLISQKLELKTNSNHLVSTYMYGENIFRIIYGPWLVFGYNSQEKNISLEKF